VLVGPGVQQLNLALAVSGVPLQHGTQLALPGPGTQPAPPLVGSQHPAPQFAAPGMQPAAHPAGGLFCPQMLPAALLLNAHPQPADPAMVQQPLRFAVAPHCLSLHEEEQCPAAPLGHVTEAQLLTEPPTLQLLASQQQQQPATDPPPVLTPQASTENSAHWKFVGVAAAAGAGTAIE
jgi:hypothetical protein